MKKAGKIVTRVISLLILLFAIFIMIFTIISVSTVNKEDADFFGYKPFIVLSDSMRAEFEVGDMVVSKVVDTDTLKEGDIITFRSIDPTNYGGVMTHKIREVTTYEGEPAFITYGTTTNVDDAYPVPADNVIGQYVFHLPKMGYFFQFLKSVPGYFLLIFTPFMILIILQAVKFFKLLKQYRREQQEELERNSQALENEKLKTQQMQEELERLKAQMAGNMPGAHDTQTMQQPQYQSQRVQTPPQSQHVQTPQYTQSPQSVLQRDWREQPHREWQDQQPVKPQQHAPSQPMQSPQPPYQAPQQREWQNRVVKPTYTEVRPSTQQPSSERASMPHEASPSSNGQSRRYEQRVQRTGQPASGTTSAGFDSMSSSDRQAIYEELERIKRQRAQQRQHVNATKDDPDGKR